MAIKRDPTSIGLSFDEQQFHRIYDCAGSTILGTDQRAPTKGMDSPVHCNMILYWSVSKGGTQINECGFLNLPIPFTP